MQQWDILTETLLIPHAKAHVPTVLTQNNSITDS